MAKPGQSPIAQGRGRAAEQTALTYLETRGLELVQQNFRCRFGEIDLIMLDGSCIVFVEVRFRRANRFGGAAASVDGRKQAKIIRTAGMFLGKQPRYADMPARFDVVALDLIAGNDAAIQWSRDAFRA